jgi:gliding motility-associated protein GldM
MVDPLTSYVTVGSTYKADIFLGAYDPQNKPIVELAKNGTVDTVKMEVIGEKEILPIGPDGKAKLEIPATGAGERTYRGVVVFRPVGGAEQRFVFEDKFEVAAPNLVVSPTKMNVFYRGVENPVEISVAGYSAKDIAPSMSNGSLSKAQQGYIVKPGKDNESTVSVTVTNADGTKKSLLGVKFRVKNVPNPAPYFAGKSVNDETIKKTELSAAQYVIAKMENFEFDLKFEVIEFTLTMIVSGTPIEKTSKGSALSGDMKEMMAKAKPGQKVYIERIKARGPDGTVRSLGTLSFKVT